MLREALSFFYITAALCSLAAAQSSHDHKSYSATPLPGIEGKWTIEVFIVVQNLPSFPISFSMRTREN